MLRVLGTLWSSLGAYYYEIFPWTVMNLLWFVGALLLPTLGISIFPHAPYLPTVLVILILMAAA
ncbi:MAG: hypothetical protein M1396_01825, partial [Chloroflexi bacterium]|nr:hypothetical protein [Chloroflexota bacterium]